ncbi:MAG TPA: hypothetical protein VGC13_17020 [Longimicrobium sp.]|uniref:hypothetical protein n=1 Tax=Longimicrobium sp. TaxID=2029185 RepID=UPI002EDABD86
MAGVAADAAVAGVAVEALDECGGAGACHPSGGRGWRGFASAMTGAAALEESPSSDSSRRRLVPWPFASAASAASAASIGPLVLLVAGRGAESVRGSGACSWLQLASSTHESSSHLRQAWMGPSAAAARAGAGGDSRPDPEAPPPAAHPYRPPCNASRSAGHTLTAPKSWRGGDVPDGCHVGPPGRVAPGDVDLAGSRLPAVSRRAGA